MNFSPQFSCPKPNCVGLYTAKSLSQHFSSKHPESVLQNNLQLKRTLRDLPIGKFNEDKAVYMLSHEKETYFVMVYGTCKVDTREPRYIGSYQYYFAIFYLLKNERTKTFYDLSITVTDGNGVDTHYSWHDRPVKLFKNENYLSKPSMFLWNTINMENKGCKYVIRHSAQLLRKPPNTNIFSEGNTCYNEIALSSEIRTIASKLECPICFEYLLTPIYLCSSGHSLCSKCKLKVTRCALCEANIGNSRNYTLEQILETLEICCTNITKGCTYTGIVKNIKMHMLNCIFKE